MRNMLEQLLALQTLRFDWPARTPEIETRMDRLRESLPTPVLTHFGRMALSGKKCVAIANNGVCSECQLRIPSGTLAALAYDNDLHLCDNCGRYLYLPEDEPLGLADKPVAAPAPTITHQRNVRLSKSHAL